MENHPKNFSPEAARNLANTPEGQKLIGLLKKEDNAKLQEAVKQAAAGNMTQVKQTLEPLLASPEIQQLLRQLGGK